MPTAPTRICVAGCTALFVFAFALFAPGPAGADDRGLVGARDAATLIDAICGRARSLGSARSALVSHGFVKAADDDRLLPHGLNRNSGRAPTHSEVWRHPEIDVQVGLAGQGRENFCISTFGTKASDVAVIDAFRALAGLPRGPKSDSFVYNRKDGQIVVKFARLPGSVNRRSIHVLYWLVARPEQ